MTHLVVLAALAAVPLIAILVLRVNGAIAFMSLCLGSVLVTYTSNDVDAVFSSVASKNAASMNQWVQLVLFLLPFLLAVLFTRGSVKGGAKNLVNFLPAAATGLLCALLAVPLLPTEIRQQIHQQSAWRQLSDGQTAIILGGAVFSLAFLLFTHRRKKGGEEDGKKGKHKG